MTLNVKISAVIVAAGGKSSFYPLYEGEQKNGLPKIISKRNAVVSLLKGE